MRLFTSALAVFAAARAIQAHPSFLQQPEPLKEWEFEATPDVDSTGHFIFDNLASLLQQWPNTLYRIGHSIVPGIIPSDTLLYHGRRDSSIPDVPQWVSTDPEHALYFCNETGWLLTLATTRPLKIIYLDGHSAFAIPGSADSADILLYGEVRPDLALDNRRRITGLCEWGQDFGLDGFVRMEADFEVMLCNFTAGVEVVSMLNIYGDFDFRKTPMRTVTAEAFGVIDSGSWHKTSPGEARIQLDAARLVSFYDSALTPSLVESRRHKARRLHRLQDLTKSDARAYVDRLEEVLRLSPESRSGVDWQTLARVIVNRYGERLELFRYIVSDNYGGKNGNLTVQARRAHDKLRLMMQPYISRSAIPENLTSIADTDDISWAAPMFKNCATAHTSSIVKRADKLLPSEQTLLSAVRETTREICRVTTRMWAQGVNAGLDRVLRPLSSSEPSSNDLRDLLSKWHTDVTTLMDWLGWSIWVKCDSPCGFEELCYLPTWPFLRTGRVDPAVPQEYDDDWKNPRPFCMSRVEPYSLF